MAYLFLDQNQPNQTIKLIMNFLNKKVIVTGANRSMGRVIAHSFAEQGADLVISYHNDAKGGQETADSIKKLGRKCKAICADFSKMENVVHFANEAFNYLGKVDILINNAGMPCRETILELSPEKMQHVFQVNTIAPLYLLQLCAKNMIENKTRGSIINISSIGANITLPKGTAYAATKAAMNKWTKSTALTLSKYGIRVNAIAPGIIQAGMNENTATTNPEAWAFYCNQIPLERVGTPEDIANMALFLASQQADWITGKVYEADGGQAL